MPMNTLHFFIQPCLNALDEQLRLHCACSSHAQIFLAVYTTAMGLVTFIQESII